jgi:hypothetical protein
MRPLLRSAAAACAYVATLAAGHTQGTCSKPETPSCAIGKGRFAREADYDQCRVQMLKYKGDMEGYAGCLDQASRPMDGPSARDELDKNLALFNRKARGELD